MYYFIYYIAIQDDFISQNFYDWEVIEGQCKNLTRFCLLLYIYELIFAVFYNGKHLTDLPYTCSVLDELIWSNEQSCPHEHF